MLFAGFLEHLFDEGFDGLGADGILEALGDDVLGDVAGAEPVDADFLAVLADLLIEDLVEAVAFDLDLQDAFRS